jgi:undecaprenyl-diphosphatase
MEVSSIMPIYQAIILAIIQGFTEFLPISSSAHLALAPWLLGWPDQGLAFDIAMHAGTLVAVVIYFFKDWLQILAQGFGIDYGSDPDLKRNPKLLWMLVAGTIPVGVAGLLFHKQAETTLRSPYVMGTMLIVVGIIMWLADRFAQRRFELDSVSFTDSLLIGAAQALAVVPGTSRSGITLSAGLFRNFTRPAAARFSFLLSTPAIAAAAAKAAWDLHKEGGVPPGMLTPMIVAIVTSGVVGLGVIAFFLKYLRTNNLNLFVCYRIIFGIIIVALAFSRG